MRARRPPSPSACPGRPSWCACGVEIHWYAPPIGATTVQARWSVGGREYTGALAAPSTAQIGDPVEIWADNSNGAWVPEPASTTRAAFEAVTAGLLIWMGVTGAAMTLTAITRRVCNRIRFARWQLGLEDLGGDGDGSTRITGER